jgi:hypothetical protein
MLGRVQIYSCGRARNGRGRGVGLGVDVEDGLGGVEGVGLLDWSVLRDSYHVRVVLSEKNSNSPHWNMNNGESLLQAPSFESSH